MYCSSCGVATAANLAYCNYCGAKLNSEKTDTTGKTTDLTYESFVMTVMAGLFVAGLVAISVLLGVMKAILKFEFGPLVGFAFLSFLVMIALEGILVSRLFRRKRTPDESAGTPSLGPNTTRELAEQSSLRSEPISSVTDETTRILEPIYKEQKVT
ncbi:MAG TPA: hypothetical protein VE961_14625 [Pyrinomonadaceae bacterium]|nr:hypothetical protein [Pyrinomonadaceae bacterium]